LTIFLSFWAMGLEEMPGSASAPAGGGFREGFLYRPSLVLLIYQKTVKFNGD